MDILCRNHVLTLFTRCLPLFFVALKTCKGCDPVDIPAHTQLVGLNVFVLEDTQGMDVSAMVCVSLTHSSIHVPCMQLL